MNTKSIPADNSIGCPSIEDKADVIDSCDVCASAGQSVLPDLLQGNTIYQSSPLLKKRISKIPVYVPSAVASRDAVTVSPKLRPSGHRSLIPVRISLPKASRIADEETRVQSNLGKDHLKSMCQSTSMRKLAGLKRNMCDKVVNTKKLCVKKQDR